MVVQMLQARPVRYPLRPSNGFLPDVADLDAAVSDRTVAIIVNSPSNPLGTVLTPDLASALVDFAIRRNL